MVIFAEAVIICNMKILIISYQYSVGLVGSIVGSIAVFYGTYKGIEGIFMFSPIEGTLEQHVGNASYWGTVGFVVVWVCLVEYVGVAEAAGRGEEAGKEES